MFKASKETRNNIDNIKEIEREKARKETKRKE
jgi:hypothetical protein